MNETCAKLSQTLGLKYFFKKERKSHEVSNELDSNLREGEDPPVLFTDETQEPAPGAHGELTHPDAQTLCNQGKLASSTRLERAFGRGDCIGESPECLWGHPSEGHPSVGLGKSVQRGKAGKHFSANNPWRGKTSVGILHNFSRFMMNVAFLIS